MAQVIKIMIVKQVKQDQQLEIMKKPTYRMKNKMGNKQKKGKMKKGKTQKKSIKKDRIWNQKHAKDVKNIWKQWYIVKYCHSQYHYECEDTAKKQIMKMCTGQTHYI